MHHTTYIVQDLLMLAGLMEKYTACLSAPISPVVMNFNQRSTFINVESNNRTVSHEEALSNLVTSILTGYQAIPLRVKIVLDRISELLGQFKMELILLNAQWTRADFNRAYKKEAGDIPLNTFRVVSEDEALDRLAALISSSPLLSNFSVLSFCRPIFHVSPIAKTDEPVRPASPIKFQSALSLPATVAASNQPIVQNDFSASLQRINETVMTMETPEKRRVMKQVKVKEEYAKEKKTPAGKIRTKVRVDCDECGKSFSDKGGLKVHKTALHIGEMHTCTVPGCGRKFNSTRSRNRHSINPNPRLHIPMDQSINSFKQIKKEHDVVAESLRQLPTSPLTELAMNIKTEIPQVEDEPRDIKPQPGLLNELVDREEDGIHIVQPTLEENSSTSRVSDPASPLSNGDLQTLLLQLMDSVGPIDSL